MDVKLIRNETNTNLHASCSRTGVDVIGRILEVVLVESDNPWRARLESGQCVHAPTSMKRPSNQSRSCSGFF